MATSIERMTNNPTALKFAAFIAQTTPPKLGYFIARLAAKWVSSHRNSGQVRAVRSNQWVIAGGESSSQFLDQAVQAVFQNSARSIYELYHYGQTPGLFERLYSCDSSFQVITGRPEFDRRGLVVAGLHMTGFDLAIRWLCMGDIKPLVLTIPNPEGGRQVEFEARQQMGMKLVPGSVNGLRQAVRYLQQGGMVVTGMDRPVPESDPQPRFFGRRAALPSHHIFLALKAQVPVVVVVSRLEEDGKLHIYASPPIEMDSYPTRPGELLGNTEKVLAVAEVFIRQAPQQWLVPLPVWPDIMNVVPG
jgi:phosphatidylinositol dimannoside acyltransferase